MSKWKTILKKLLVCNDNTEEIIREKMKKRGQNI